MSLLTDRRALITGIANNRSIAWAIAQACARAGAKVVLTYQSERLRANVEALGKLIQAVDVLPLDVSHDGQWRDLAENLTQRWGALDCVLHGAAFAQRSELTGRFSATTRSGFAQALDVSAYSLVALAQHLLPLLERGDTPSILTLTYLGADRAMPHYNVMGVAKAALQACVRYLAADLGPQNIRVNAISAGPVRTLSAASIAGFRTMLQHVAEDAPLRRNIQVDEVADAALFILSPLARGMTGEIMHVDAGYHVVGAPKMPEPLRAPGVASSPTIEP